MAELRNAQELKRVFHIPEANIHAREYQLYLPSKDELQRKLMEWIGEQDCGDE